jgi:hypothetical protein
VIRVILDASAIATYAAREPDSMSVSELIAQVAETNDAVGVPALAFIAAFQASSPEAREVLEDFVSSAPQSIKLLALQGEDTPTVASMCDDLAADKVHALIESSRYDAYVASYDVWPMARFAHEDDLIQLK